MIKNLYELYNLIEKVSTALPNVNQFVNSFDSLNREDTSYAAVVLQFRDGTQATEGSVRYRFYLGYVDRVNENTDTPSTSNNILIQSIAEENIRLIINKLYPEVDITFGNTFYPFTQRFTALTAGCYVELAITLAVKDCNYESGSVLRDVEIVSDSNGVKEVVPGAGVDGFKKVIVRTEVPLKEEVEKSINIVENGNTMLVPNTGQSFSKVNIDVNVPIKEEVAKEISITSNGLTIITPPTDKTLSKVDVNVNVPTKTEVAKDIVITENGNTTYTPEAGEVFNSVSVDVNVSGGGGKLKVQDGWSFVYTDNTQSLIEMIDTSEVTQGKNFNAMGMFEYCCAADYSSLDLSNVRNALNMFAYPRYINGTETYNVPLNKMTNCINFNNICANIAGVDYGLSGWVVFPTNHTYDDIDLNNALTNNYKVSQVSLNYPNASVSMSEFLYMTAYDSNVHYSDFLGIQNMQVGKIKNIDDAFRGCTKMILFTADQGYFDASELLHNGSGSLSPFYQCISLTTLSGFRGLNLDFDLSTCTALTHDSLMNVINEAADVSASPKTLTLGTTNLNKLTDEEKAIATNKGWVLA